MQDDIKRRQILKSAKTKDRLIIEKSTAEIIGKITIDQCENLASKLTKEIMGTLQESTVVDHMNDTKPKLKGMLKAIDNEFLLQKISENRQ